MDPKAAGNGSGGPNWVDAFTDLPTALVAAGANDSILIAEDTYVPVAAPGATARTATFTVRPGQTLIGGYLGVDGGMNASLDPTNPDGAARGTILTGELGNVENLTDNAYTVVTITGTAGSFQVVKNLTIQDGYAQLTPGGVGAEVQGGGMHALLGSIEVVDVTFKDNYAEEEGGALWFDGNNGFGIGVTRCTFWRNKCGQRGGGAFVKTPNAAAHMDHDEAWIMNCMFFDNTAGVTATNLLQAGGGAIWFSDRLNTDIFVANNQVIANSCRGHGSGYGTNGGAVNATLRIINDTFYGNQTTAIDPGVTAGWVLDFAATSQLTTTISNSIVWGNTWQTSPSGSLYLSDIRPGVQIVEYSDVETGEMQTQSPYPGIGNIDEDPMFANPAGFDFRLLAGSRCIDTGWITPLPPDYGDTDEDGDRMETLPVDWTSTQLRVIDSGPVGQGLCGAGTSFCGPVDMGARESN